MNPQKEDLQHPLQQLEEEINSSVPKVVINQQQQQTSFIGWKSKFDKLTIWFKNLPGIGKLAVGGIGVLLGLAILQAFLKLVASVISLTVLAVLVYLGYKFFVSGSFQHKQ